MDFDFTPVSKNLALSDYDAHLPYWRLENLKKCALHLELSRPRTLAWAIMLEALPSLENDVILSLSTHRKFYNDLKEKLCTNPRAVLGDDPLSQSDESAWNQYFLDEELKALILQDVVRTYPEEEFFRRKEVQELMVQVLFFWSRCHPNVGYRQGMHEVLALLLLELHLDRKYAPKRLSDTVKCYLEDSHLEHDSFMLFSTVMKSLEKFYSTGDAVPLPCGRLPPSTARHRPSEVVRYLNWIKDEYLTVLEPELASNLARCNVTMEVFGIRWLRLLFGREFPRAEVPHVWGFIFADGPEFPHTNLHYLVVALLVSMKRVLLNPEPSVVTMALMRGGEGDARRVCWLAAKLRGGAHPAPRLSPHTAVRATPAPPRSSDALEVLGSAETSGDPDSEVDVGRSLAALACVRARLPRAARALSAALPRPLPQQVQRPLAEILQLASFLECRNHTLVDVETALEAAEGQSTDFVSRQQTMPARVEPLPKTVISKPREVALQVFHQSECTNSDNLPSLDPIGIRTD